MFFTKKNSFFIFLACLFMTGCTSIPHVVSDRQSGVVKDYTHIYIGYVTALSYTDTYEPKIQIAFRQIQKDGSEANTFDTLQLAPDFRLTGDDAGAAKYLYDLLKMSMITGTLTRISSNSDYFVQAIWVGDSADKN